MSDSVTLSVDDALRQAIEHHRSGRLQDAERVYRAILEIQPSHPDANHNLGMLAVQVNQPAKALSYFKAALDADPNQGQFALSYSETLLTMCQANDALNVLRGAMQRGLDSAAAHALLKRIDAARKKQLPQDEMDRLVALFNAEQDADFENGARQATMRYPDSGGAWKALGVSLLIQGKHALPAMQKAAELLPWDSEVHNNLGYAFQEQGVLDKAEACYRRALELNPDYAEAHNNLGNTLTKQRRFDEAAVSCRQALELKPEYADAHNNLGNALMELGLLDEAIISYQRALEINPENAEASNNLGNVYQALGQLDKAMASYQRALEIKPGYCGCHGNLSGIKTFKPGDPQILQMRELHATVRDEKDKLYLCFALAKACEDIGEYDQAFKYYREGNRLRKKELGYSIEQDQALFGKIKSAFATLPEMEPVLPQGAKSILIVGMPRSGTSLVEQILASHGRVHGAGELEQLGRLTAKHFGDAQFDLAIASRRIAGDYFGELEKLAGGRDFVTDKMPINFRWLGILLAANPEIKVVHTIRNPIATCWSNFRTNFPAEALGFAFDMDDLAAYYKLYQDLMAFWHEKFPGRIYDLDYERLTGHQGEETRKLLDYCGLPWEEACLEFEKTDRAVSTASALQVRKKLYQGSSEAWRKFEKHLQPLKKGLA